MGQRPFTSSSLRDPRQEEELVEDRNDDRGLWPRFDVTRISERNFNDAATIGYLRGGQGDGKGFLDFPRGKCPDTLNHRLLRASGRAGDSTATQIDRVRHRHRDF